MKFRRQPGPACLVAVFIALIIISGCKSEEEKARKARVVREGRDSAYAKVVDLIEKGDQAESAGEHQSAIDSYLSAEDAAEDQTRQNGDARFAAKYEEARQKSDKARSADTAALDKKQELERLQQLQFAQSERIKREANESQSADIFTAARQGYRERIEELLMVRPELVNEEENGETPLFEAHTKETAELLIKHGANVKFGSGFNRTPLHAAAENGCVDVAEVLLQHGADVNAQYVYGTPLRAVFPIMICDWARLSHDEHVISDQQRAMCRFLVAHGADVNAECRSETLLHEFASSSRPPEGYEIDLDSVQFIVSLGPSPSVIDEAYRQAVVDGNQDIADLLRAKK